MTKAELLDYAAAHGITGVSESMTKARILAILSPVDDDLDGDVDDDF